MPVELSETIASGFLREFNFHTLTQALIDELLGEVKRPDWLKIELSAQPDALRRQFLFTIGVTLREHQRRVDLGPSSRGVADWRKLGLKRSRTFVSEFPLPESVIHEFRGDVPTMYRRWIEGALLGNAHRFYEADPRIGWRYGAALARGQLPVSRLLDPREPFSRTGLPMLQTEGLSRGDPIQEELKSPCCPFCREEHSWSQAPVWAGANLLWVHPGCWRTS